MLDVEGVEEEGVAASNGLNAKLLDVDGGGFGANGSNVEVVLDVVFSEAACWLLLFVVESEVAFGGAGCDGATPNFKGADG